MTEALFNAVEAAMRREPGFFLLHVTAAVFLFGFAFLVERYKLLQEGVQ